MEDENPSRSVAPERELTTSSLMTPELANFAGNVHGGHVLRLVDQVAYACASQWWPWLMVVPRSSHRSGPNQKRTSSATSAPSWPESKRDMWTAWQQASRSTTPWWT